MTPEEYLTHVLSQLAPLPVAEVPIDEAYGLVAAADVTSGLALPPFANSAMDGYAVRVVDVAGAEQGAPVTLAVQPDSGAAGGWPAPLATGLATKIMTGAPLPEGADAVVPYEWTDAGVAQVQITQAPALGQHVRVAGEDVRAGDVVITAGTQLSARHLGLLASIGHATVAVRRRARVLIVSTGSELVAPGQPLAPGQIYDSNSTMLVALVREAGAEPTSLGFVRDDPESFLAALTAALEGIDLVVTSGGVSMGDFDVVKAALASQGVTFTRVDMQPGKPQGFGFVSGVPIVTLPGNPVSSYVSWEVFVRPAVRHLMGKAPLSRPLRQARLVAPITSPEGKQQYLRAQVVAGPEGLSATQVGGPGSHLLARLTEANALLIVPPEVTKLDPGDLVQVLAIDGEEW